MLLELYLVVLDGYFRVVAIDKLVAGKMESDQPWYQTTVLINNLVEKTYTDRCMDNGHPDSGG